MWRRPNVIAARLLALLDSPAEAGRRSVADRQEVGGGHVTGEAVQTALAHFPPGALQPHLEALRRYELHDVAALGVHAVHTPNGVTSALFAKGLLAAGATLSKEG